MVFEGCRRCSEGLWAEEDIGSRLKQLHDQVTRLRQTWSAGGALNSVADVDLPFAGEDLTGRRAAPHGRPRAAPVTFAPETTAENTFHHGAQHSKWTPGRLPGFIDREVQMSRAGTERSPEYMMQDPAGAGHMITRQPL